MYEEVFSMLHNLYAAFSPEKLFKVFSPADNESFFECLRKNGGRFYDLVEHSGKAEEILQHAYRKGISEDKLLPDNYQLAVDILATNQIVALVSLNNQTAVVIQDQDIASAIVTFFNIIWQTLLNYRHTKII